MSDPKCDLCGGDDRLVLLQKCHISAPLRATLDGSVLVLSCYVPACGREVVRLTSADIAKAESREPRGLHEKFRVVRRSTGDEVKGCFVLRPSRDKAARAALLAYAAATENHELAADLRVWVERLERESGSHG